MALLRGAVGWSAVHDCGITVVVMGGTLGHFFKPEKNIKFFRLKKSPRYAVPGKLE